MSISDEDSAHDARDTFNSAVSALQGSTAATARPPGEAGLPLKEKAAHAFDEVSVDADRVAQRGAATVDSGLGAVTAAFSRAQATFARDPKKSVMVITVVAIGIYVLTSLARRL